MATSGTADYSKEMLVFQSVLLTKLDAEGPNLLDVIQNGEAQFVINTLTKGKQPERDGFRIRRESVENGVPCLTSLDTAEAILRVIESMNFSAEAMEQPIEAKEVVHS